jgi:hypothetical protein
MQERNGAAHRVAAKEKRRHVPAQAHPKQLGVHAMHAQRFVQHPRVLEGHRLVLRAVEEKERRCILSCTCVIGEAAR